MLTHVVSSTWTQFNNGDTLGHRGSEGGTIIRDEMFPDGARITLEKNTKTAAFAITCGIVNWLVHTVYLSTEESAQRTFELIKSDLESMMRYVNREPFISEDSMLLVEQLKDFIRRF